jgi:hypothetical protein
LDISLSGFPAAMDLLIARNGRMEVGRGYIFV